MLSEVDQKIINMIAKNSTANEISKATGLTNKQLYYRLYLLRTKGFNFSKKYYYNGEISYRIKKGFTEEQDISLLTSSQNKEIRLALISDLHFGNNNERIDALNKVYEYCSRKGINIIINGGDILDGYLGKSSDKIYANAEDQIDYMLKNYPFDKNIINFVCLGNHDFSILMNDGKDIETILNARRHDIVSLGYHYGEINIKNEKIIVVHPNNGKELILPSEGLVLRGHSHRYRIMAEDRLTKVYLPTLSGIKIDNQGIPAFIDATIGFDNGNFSYGFFQEYVFLDKMYKVGEVSIPLYSANDQDLDFVKYEEEKIFGQEASLTLKKKKRLNQIDKFNQKYGL